MCESTAALLALYLRRTKVSGSVLYFSKYLSGVTKICDIYVVQSCVIAIVAFEILCVFFNDINIFQLIITLLLIVKIG